MDKNYGKGLQVERAGWKEQKWEHYKEDHDIQMFIRNKKMEFSFERASLAQTADITSASFGGMSQHEKKTLGQLKKGEQSISSPNTLNTSIHQLNVSYQSRHLQNHIYLSYDLMHLFDPFQKFIKVKRSVSVTQGTENTV